jgi:hypothetical protein
MQFLFFKSREKIIIEFYRLSKKVISPKLTNLDQNIIIYS